MENNDDRSDGFGFGNIAAYCFMSSTKVVVFCNDM